MSEHRHSTGETPNAEQGHASLTVNTPAVFLGAALLVLFVVASFFAMDWLFDLFVSEEPPAPAAQRPVLAPTPSEPPLLAAPEQELREVRAKESAALGSYGWVDRQERVARIPIDRAIDILATRGIPAGGLDTKGKKAEESRKPQEKKGADNER